VLGVVLHCSHKALKRRMGTHAVDHNRECDWFLSFLYRQLAFFDVKICIFDSAFVKKIDGQGAKCICSRSRKTVFP